MPRSSSTNRRHRSASEIRKLLSLFHSSTVSRAEFVQTEGLCLSTLRKYLNTHRTRTRTRTRTPRTPQSTKPPAFLELELAPLPPLASPQRGDYRLQLRTGVVLEIPQGFSSREVAVLVALVSKTCPRRFPEGAL